MALRVYNTLTQTKEPFVPLEPGRVRMYVCGVTVYDQCHMGHARAYVAFDVVYRWLKASGYEVTYVRNFTDVDDKIIKRANEIGIPARDLADRFIAEFRRDMAALGVLPVDVEPRVTDHIPEIVRTIQAIVDRGHGYESGGDVFFDIDSFPSYGALSRRKLDDMQVAVRDNVQVDERKRNPLDFVLWKASKPGEPAWDSPWGAGRPGWHIECSTMSAKHLGTVFDIHGGGKDLVFPHHENEIAQSQAASGEPPVRVWMHNGFVTVDSEKMAKSLGNFQTICGTSEQFHPLALRYFLMTTHYRSPINYSTDNLEEATRRIEYIGETLEKIDRWLAQGPGAGVDEVLGADRIAAAETGFREAMDDDFNTAAAIGVLSDLLAFANQIADAKDKAEKKRRPATLKRIRAVLTPIFGVLGLFEGGVRPVLEGIRDRKLSRLTISRTTIEERLAERRAAREAKDFARSDAIRDELLAEGVVVMDGPAGTTWKVA
jgi:cysteinyl-tRNA synthetase